MVPRKRSPAKKGICAVDRLGSVPGTVRRPSAVISARLLATTGLFAMKALIIGPSRMGRVGVIDTRTPRW